ncbi:MAG: OpgC domain-containing protein [Pseudomonadota bacterium]
MTRTPAARRAPQAPFAGNHLNCSAPTPPRPRDVRLDFFRGLGMFIIFMSHMPMNDWAQFIPARFGFSDATEIFVFCSGMASAIAFGRLFDERGFGIGLARVSYRCWQVYWAHIGLFMVLCAAMVFADQITNSGTKYQGGLNLLHFLQQDTGALLIGLLTLTYVPNLFDILPMYLVLLAMIPVVMLLGRIHPIAVFVAMAACYALVYWGGLELSAEPWSDRVWFFNPFAWQLVFFTGFAFARGWLPTPPVSTRLILLAAGVVIGCFPIAYWPIASNVPVLKETWDMLGPIASKTNFGLLRFWHFLAVAYLAYALAGEAGARLRGGAVRVICKVGQQALGVFMAGVFLSMTFGVFIDEFGRTAVNVAIANLTGFALLIAVAYVAEFYKSAPWRKAAGPRPASAAAQQGGLVGGLGGSATTPQAVGSAPASDGQDMGLRPAE